MSEVVVMKKILVVDDQQSGHLVLQNLIENEEKGVKHYINVKMISAFSGKEAIDIALKESPDIILMDINMPDQDGLETTEQIRKRNEIKDVYIIALTAQAMNEDRERCLKSGCNDYISKPFEVVKLVEYLSSVLRGNNVRYQ